MKLEMCHLNLNLKYTNFNKKILCHNSFQIHILQALHPAIWELGQEFIIGRT